MIDFNFVPETLEWCTTHYTPPIKAYINCPGFGNSDGTVGFCWHCMEMTPYQHEMCRDESWMRSLLSPYSAFHCKTREEAAEFIENNKQRHPQRNIIDCLYELHQRAKEEYDGQTT